MDILFCECGEIVYLKYMVRVKLYLNEFYEEEKIFKFFKWKFFDDKKVLIVIVVSVLKFGKINIVSINDNDWISYRIIEEVELLK